MKRTILLLVIVGLSLATGTGLVVHDWSSIPSRATGSSLDDVRHIARAYPEQEVTKWNVAVSDGRESLLSRDEAVLSLIAGNPADAPLRRFGKAFEDSLTLQRQIPEMPSRVVKISRVLNSLDDNRKLSSTLGSLDIQNYLMESTNPEARVLVKEALGDLHRRLVDFVIADAVGRVIRDAMERQLTAGDSAKDKTVASTEFELCLELGENARTKVGALPLPEAKKTISELIFRAKERIRWLPLRSLGNNESNAWLLDKEEDLEDFRRFIADFERKEHEPHLEHFKDHLSKAKRVLAWNEMIQGTDPSIVALLREPGDDDRKFDFNNVNLDSTIRDLHAFCRKYPNAAQYIRARIVCTTLLHEMFKTNNALIPDGKTEKTVQIIERETGVLFRGRDVPEDSTDSVVVLFDQEGNRKIPFLRAALKGPPVLDPRYTEERDYEKEYKPMDARLKNNDWRPETLEQFVEKCRNLGPKEKRERRIKAAEQLLELVKQCTEFHPEPTDN